MDSRLRTAVDASLGWYADMFALHEIPTLNRDGLWSAMAKPPPLHSSAKTLVPGVEPSRILKALDSLPGGGVADSFGDVPLAGEGFDLLFEASWIHHPPVAGAAPPPGWSVVSTPDELAAWVTGHGTDGIFLPGILDLPQFRLHRRHTDGNLTAGVITHETAAAVSVSNAWVATGHGLGWSEVLAVVAALRADRPVTDYTYGRDLDDALAHGFTALGPQRVWVR